VLSTRKPSPRPWARSASRDLALTPVFRLAAHTSVHPDRPDAPHDFYVLHAPEWVNVVPLVDDRTVVMVRQFRHGIQRFTLEIPGGMMDPGDVDPGEAARRELLEETGYLAGRIEPAGRISPNPAIQSNMCHSFVATELSRQGAPCTDGTEETEVVLVPLARIPAMIRAGEICHALVVVAFCHLLGLQGSEGTA
jgi:ADP-ribose pyrophosphatase